MDRIIANNLLKKASEGIKNWDSGLLKTADTMNDLLPKFNPTVEREGRKEWAQGSNNPFGNKGNQEDKSPLAVSPKGPDSEPDRTEKEERWMGQVGVKSSLLKSADPHATYHLEHDNDLAPREDLQDHSNREIKKKFKKETDETNGDLTPQERTDRNCKKVISSLKAITSATPSVEIYDQCMVVNIPKTAKRVDLTAQKINQMENQISKALNVRAKYDHISVSPKFEGVSLEFLLV